MITARAIASAVLIAACLAAAAWAVTARWRRARAYRKKQQRQRHDAAQLSPAAEKIISPMWTPRYIATHTPIIVHPCGCMPCPAHSAAQAAREKARAGRDAWAAEWDQKLEQQ